MGRRKRNDGREYYGRDKPAAIRLCLTCTRKDCSNCLAYQKKDKETAKKRETEKEK